MNADGKIRRLLVAVGDAALAFTVAPRPIEGGFERRLLIALSDSAPAFGSTGRVRSTHAAVPTGATPEGLAERIQVHSSSSQGPWPGLGGRAIEEIAALLKAFTPEQIDISQVWAQITNIIARPATPDEDAVPALDNFINALVDQWTESVRTQYVAYRADVVHRETEARAWLAANQRTLDLAKEQLEDAALALAAAKGNRATRRAARAYQKAFAKHALSQEWLARADSAHNRYTNQLQAAEVIVESETQVRRAQGDQMKQLTRLEIAARLKDPSATDALLPSESANDSTLSGSDRPADK